MSEAEVVASSVRPGTEDALLADLVTLGVAPGDVVIVHSSLSALGWVSGGAVAVVRALLAAVGTAGTIVVPTHTGHLTDPARWQHPPVPAEWVPVIRDSVPPFDPAVEPSRRMGAIAEVVRTWPGTVRSDHPHLSFAAHGAQAEAVTAGHALEWSLGEGSPLARAYDLGAKVLLLGTRNCTSLHLAEVRAGLAPAITQGAALLVDGVRQWVEFTDGDYDDTHFDEVLTEFCAARGIAAGQVGRAEALLLDQPALVDFAVARLPVLLARAPLAAGPGEGRRP